MRLWLTRRLNGQYALTAMRPVIAQVRGAGGLRDVYLQPGEPIGVLNLCALGIRAAVKRELRPLQPMRVRLSMRLEKACR